MHLNGYYRDLTKFNTTSSTWFSKVYNISYAKYNTFIALGYINNELPVTAGHLEDGEYVPDIIVAQSDVKYTEFLPEWGGSYTMLRFSVNLYLYTHICVGYNDSYPVNLYVSASKFLDTLRLSDNLCNFMAGTLYITEEKLSTNNRTRVTVRMSPFNQLKIITGSDIIDYPLYSDNLQSIITINYAYVIITLLNNTIKVRAYETFESEEQEESEGLRDNLKLNTNEKVIGAFTTGSYNAKTSSQFGGTTSFNGTILGAE